MFPLGVEYNQNFAPPPIDILHTILIFVRNRVNQLYSNYLISNIFQGPSMTCLGAYSALKKQLNILAPISASCPPLVLLAVLALRYSEMITPKCPRSLLLVCMKMKIPLRLKGYSRGIGSTVTILLCTSKTIWTERRSPPGNLCLMGPIGSRRPMVERVTD